MTKEFIFEHIKHTKLPQEVSQQITLDSIKEVRIEGAELILHLRLPIPNLNLRRKTAGLLEQYLQKKIPEYKINILISIDKSPPSLTETKSSPKGLEGVTNIIAVASGKGGVGKSTLTSNLAICLSKMGFQVGIVDADIFGPSIPIMFETIGERPLAVNRAEHRMIAPIEKHGIKMLSMGFFAGESEAMVWRGPMASKALKQILHDGDWGNIDFMLVDLPPGTSDVHLSLVQMVPVTGALMVSTPQNLALADMKKGAGMFRMSSINVPILGIVENMSYFSPPEFPDKKYYLFGRDGVKKFAEEYNIPFLGEIPISTDIQEASDSGGPITLKTSHPYTFIYKSICQKMVSEVLKRNKDLPVTEIVRISNMSGCS